MWKINMQTTSNSDTYGNTARASVLVSLQKQRGEPLGFDVRQAQQKEQT